MTQDTTPSARASLKRPTLVVFLAAVLSAALSPVALGQGGDLAAAWAFALPTVETVRAGGPAGVPDVAGAVPRAWRFDARRVNGLAEAVTATERALNAGALDAGAPSAPLRLEATATGTDAGGVRHHRYRELGPGGHPVLGGGLVVHEGPGTGAYADDDLTATGTLFPAARFAAAPSARLRAREARAAAEATFAPASAFRDAGDLEPTTLYWAPEGLDFDDGAYRLCYRVDVYATASPRREYVFVDAASGALVARYPRLHSAAGPGHAHACGAGEGVHAAGAGTEEAGTAETMYAGTRDITTERTAAGAYRLYQEDARGIVIHTRDARNATDFFDDYDEVTDDDNDWTGDGIALKQPARDAFWASGAYADFMRERFDWSSMDDDGHALVSYVHVGTAYANAFWDGEASYYGDGEPGFTIGAPLTTVAVVGHEFTHGFVQFTADLIYRDESGALNESFADIFGQGLRAREIPERAGDYRIGSDVDPAGVGFRSMSDPGLHDHPDTYGGADYYTGTFDNGGVHINSGVQNHWFYLLVEGGTGVNDLGVAYDVAAISREDALSVAHATVAYYLTASSTFADASAASVLAAGALFGTCDARTRSVAAAWNAVGLPVAGAEDLRLAASATQVCEVGTATVLTAVGPEGAEVTWDLGDGTAATGDTVVHTYAPGAYHVSATVVGCGGDPISARLADSIRVDAEAPACFAYPLPIDGSADDVVACVGTFSDASGDQSYGNRWDGSLVVRHPAGAGGFTLTVEAFDTESGFDFLTVSALGAGGATTQIGRYSGRQLGPGDTLGIPAAAAGFVARFTTDGSVTAPGFTIGFEATGGDAEAVAGFGVSPSPSVLSPVRFTAAAEATGALSYDLGDGRYVASAGRDLAHVYSAPGTYAVTQYARTCASVDSATAEVVVAAGSTVCAAVDTTYLTVERGSDGTFAVEIENCGPRDLQLAGGPRDIAPARTSYRAYGSTDSAFATNYTVHEFPPLAAAADDLRDVELVVRYSGDFDAADEYLLLYSSIGYYALEADGDPANGTWLEHRVVVPSNYYDNLVSSGLFVECANSSAVGTGEGGADAHEVTLRYRVGDTFTEVAFSRAPPLAPGATTTATVTVSAEGIPAGVYAYDEVVLTNDTSLAGGRLRLPVVLTVPTSAEGRFSPDSLEAGRLYEGFEASAGVRLYNDGGDPLVVDSVHVGGGLIAGHPLRPGQTVLPGRSTYLSLALLPEDIGEDRRDTLTVFYGAGRHTRLPVRADVAGAPVLRLGATTESDRVVDTLVLVGDAFADSIYLHNDGSAVLDADLDAYAYGVSSVTLSPSGRVAVAPGDSVLVTVTIPATALRTVNAFELEVAARSYTPRFAYDERVWRFPAIVRAPAPVITTPAVSCGASVAFEAEERSAATYAWSFGDGATATAAAPSHTYAADGTYAVVLETCNRLGCASDTLSLEVFTDCETVVMDRVGTQTARGCRMRVFDAGGAAGEIRGYQTRTLRLTSETGAPLDLSVASFSTSPYTSLRVYDGATDAAPLLAEWRGDVAVGTAVRSGLDGLYLAWETDTYYGGEGYALDVTCAGGDRLLIGGNPQPACAATYEFGAYAPRADTWRWSFGDGRGSLSQNPTHVYAHSGRYPVIVYASGPDAWADTTAMVAVVSAEADAYAVAVEMIGDSTVAAAKTFSVSGAPTGAEVRWTSSEGHDLTGALVQVTFATAGRHYVDAAVTPQRGCPARGTRTLVLEGASSAGGPNAAAAFEVFPNPASGSATVRLRGWDFAAGAVDLTLADALGRVVYGARVDAETTVVPLAQLPAGVYALTLRRADGTRATRSLVVE